MGALATLRLGACDRNKKPRPRARLFLDRKNYFLVGLAGIAGAAASCDLVASDLAVCFLAAIFFDACFLGASAGFSAMADEEGVAAVAWVTGSDLLASAAIAERLKAPTIVAATREDISLFISFSRVIKWVMQSRIASAWCTLCDVILT